MAGEQDDDVRRMFKPGKYLGAWDFASREATLTIDRVQSGEVEGENGRKDKAPLIFFKGVTRPLVLNKTNLKVLLTMYPQIQVGGRISAKAMKGLRVTLYQDTTRGARGGTVDCVRIKPRVPGSTTGDAPPPEVPVDEEMRAKQVAEMEPKKEGE